jgi:hypothetical protein
MAAFLTWRTIVCSQSHELFPLEFVAFTTAILVVPGLFVFVDWNPNKAMTIVHIMMTFEMAAFANFIGRYHA